MTIAVVIPCYRVRRSIDDVLRRVGPEVAAVYVVDDACPNGTGEHVAATCADPRVRVLRNETNLGVGGATVRGWRAALADGATVVVKIDGDGQMDPTLLPRLVRPLLDGEADYAKGNRLAAFAGIRARSRATMPRVRWIGNSLLTFGHKAVSGYWHVADPTNGFTAIHRAALEGLDLDALSPRYFFETDVLCQLNLIDAVVRDVPMPSAYGDEVSSLRVAHTLRDFPPRMLRRLLRRIVWEYFLFDFNVASLEMLAGAPLVLFGLGFGVTRWIIGVRHGRPNTAGTVMLAALPLILGVQLLLAAVSYDVSREPRVPLSRARPSTGA
jgi:glycosyltransferase involved in cell wall biosynthesis